MCLELERDSLDRKTKQVAKLTLKLKRSRTENEAGGQNWFNHLRVAQMVRERFWDVEWFYDCQEAQEPNNEQEFGQLARLQSKLCRCENWPDFLPTIWIWFFTYEESECVLLMIPLFDIHFRCRLRLPDKSILIYTLLGQSWDFVLQWRSWACPFLWKLNFEGKSSRSAQTYIIRMYTDVHDSALAFQARR